MKTLGIIFTTALVTAVGMTAYFWLGGPANPGFPLVHLFQATNVERVETENKNLRMVVDEVLKQTEAKTGKKVNVIYATEEIANHRQMVFGNPPMEGCADHALFIACCDFGCRMRYLDAHTILFFRE